jgi:hypothetical protein
MYTTTLTSSINRELPGASDVDAITQKSGIGQSPFKAD